MSDRAKGLTRLQGWLVLGDLVDERRDAHPRSGSGVGVWALDGVLKTELRHTWDDSPFLFARGPLRSRTVALTAAIPYSEGWLDPARWSTRARTVDLRAEYAVRAPEPTGTAFRATFLAGGMMFANALRQPSFGDRVYARVELEATRQFLDSASRRALSGVRGYLGVGRNLPRQRGIGVASPDAIETFGVHWLRPWDGPLAKADVHYVQLGAGGLRGYSPLLRVGGGTDIVGLAAVNADASWAVLVPRPSRPGLYVGLFGDAGKPLGPGAFDDPFENVLIDGGVGVAVRGHLYDRDLRARVDFPVAVRNPRFAAGGRAGDEAVKFRWTFSFTDLW